MPKGTPPRLGRSNSFRVPPEMRPRVLLPTAVYQTVPLLSDVIQYGLARPDGMGYSVKMPEGVIMPILLPSYSVNQMLPEGSTAIPVGVLPEVGTGNSVISPDVVFRRPILLPARSVNQTF